MSFGDLWELVMGQIYSFGLGECHIICLWYLVITEYCCDKRFGEREQKKGSFGLVLR